MGNRRHIEELRDELSILRHDAEFLHRYGSPASSVGLFNRLSQDDRKRLIYLALAEGDADVQSVAHYLMQKLTPAPRNKEELFAQMSSEDRTELEDEPLKPRSLTPIDERRIIEELRKARDQIGFLEVEEAFWILIPHDLAEEAAWIEAVGGQDEISSHFRNPFLVVYDPKKEEKYALITAIRTALWILHIHNHPELPGYISLCEPSDNDQGFALQWKAVRPELASKMKFFVVQADNVVEYSLPQGGTKRWQI
jgi:hypothetical protein